MKCDLETFCNEILGKWGFTMADWVYLQNAWQMEREIQRQIDIRDGLTNKTKPELLSDLWDWVSVKDRLPEDLQDVLFTDGKTIYKGYNMKSCLDDSCSWFSDTDYTIDDVTHWSHLPLLPKKELEE